VLYKENPLYRIAEHIFIGAAAGYAIVLGLSSVYTKAIVPMSVGNFTYIIPLILGLLIFGVLSKRHYWIGRYPIALLVGAGTGLSIRAMPKANIIAQIAPTLSIVSEDISITISNIILWIAVFSAIIYFIFTIQYKGTYGKTFENIGKIGRYLMFAAFGTSYGGTIMTRLAILIPQVQRLVSPQNAIATVVGLILFILVLYYKVEK
jgi:hypothetical protein